MSTRQGGFLLGFRNPALCTLNTMTSVPVRVRQQKIAQRHTEERAVATAAETGAMQPQAKGCTEPPELKEARNRFSARAPEGARPCQHLDFRLPGL